MKCSGCDWEGPLARVTTPGGHRSEPLCLVCRASYRAMLRRKGFRRFELLGVPPYQPAHRKPD